MAIVNFGHFPALPRGVPPNSTLAKNHVMRRIVRLFPEVELTWLRHQIQQHDHSHFYKVVDTMFDTYLFTPYPPQRLLPNVNQQQRHRRHQRHTSSLSSSSSSSTPSIKGKESVGNKDGNDDDDDDFGQEPLIEPWEYIRSPEYIKSVRRQLYNEFPKVWKSTIKAVMAENNFDYVRTHDRLLQLETENSWARWFSDVLSFIQRAKISRAGEDPPEFLDSLASLHRRERDQQSAQDQAMAQKINADQYRTLAQTIECGCCFSDFCFEEMAACQEGHLFCKECIQRYVQEGLFGQGELRGRAAALAGGGQGGHTLAHAIRCIEGSGCQALFSEAMLESALTPAMYEQYTRVAFQADLDRSGLEVVGCPFCDYAEVDEQLRVVWLPWHRTLRSSIHDEIFGVSALTWLTHVLVPLLSITTFLVGFLVHALVLVLLLVPLLVALIPMTFMRDYLQEVVNGMVRNIQIRRRGNAFHCKGCGRISCLNCSQERKPFHKCHENLAEGLRLQVEKAMTEAVKRTCPKCNLSFVKESGCNKMRCSCGYVMCFLCRKDIREEGYKHFCNHFRAIAGPCTQCTKCDLYIVEKDEEAARKAATVARTEYLRMNPMARQHLQNDQTLIGPAPDTTFEDLACKFRRNVEDMFELLFIEDAAMISLILQSLEVEDAEQNVIHQLLDFAHRYTVDVFQDALLYSEHAGTNDVGLDDVRLAIQGRVNHSFTSPPPKEFLLELAEAKNRVPLPLIPDKYGIRLPPERHCLTAVNFQLIPELPPLGTQSAPDLQDIKPDPDMMKDNNKEAPSLAGHIHFNIKRADSDEEMDDVAADHSSSSAGAAAPPPLPNQQNLADHDQWKRKRADDDDNYDD
ncbi:hypothetical protein DFQ27_007625 [Actinomortierella ambigua]|uniref:RING-type domain-containing protein n=1 Tax=Actinomortierella ambigua TaxID=1343610 RepID=A0A9P6PV52_9FUNG|nr:hypothetical protein DFQ27_007625 [Actinomortierella ambigua]